MMRHLFCHITCLLTVALLIAACSADDGQEPGLLTDQPSDTFGRLSIRIALPEASSQTRAIADSGWEEGETEERAISNYYLLICNGNKIEQAIKGGTAQSDSHDNTKNYDISSAEIESMVLPAGTYNFTSYCLANFTDDMLTATGLTLDEGKKITNETLPDGFEERAITIANTSAIPSGGIPMTGKLEKTVTIASGTTAVDEPLVLWRAMAKVEFRFFSAASTDVTVKKIKLRRITSSPVYLFSKRNLNQDGSNRDTYDSAVFPLFPTGHATTDYEYELLDGGLKVEKDSHKDKEHAVSTSLYINESVADAASQRLAFTLTTERVVDGEIKTTDENYLLTDLAFILRNDHVVIPICLTDYIFKPEFFYYDPIGGVHDPIEEVEGAFYYQVSKSKADFAIVPNLYDARTNQRVTLATASGSAEAGKLNWSCTGDEIFSGSLTRESDGLEFIKGTFNNTTGKAVITFTYTEGSITLTRDVTIEEIENEK